MARQVNTTRSDELLSEWNPLLLECLCWSDDDNTEVRQVRISYNGSRQQYAPVQLQGVPTSGAVDSGADITIVGGELFRRVAAVAKLRRSQLKKVDKIPHTYDQKTFSLDGRVDLDLTFNGVTLNTPVYVKMDSPEPLLLAEGVCRQLEIISYHPDVIANTSQLKKRSKKEDRAQCAKQGDATENLGVANTTLLGRDDGGGRATCNQERRPSSTDSTRRAAKSNPTVTRCSDDTAGTTQATRKSTQDRTVLCAQSVVATEQPPNSREETTGHTGRLEEQATLYFKDLGDATTVAERPDKEDNPGAVRLLEPDQSSDVTDKLKRGVTGVADNGVVTPIQETGGPAKAVALETSSAAVPPEMEEAVVPMVRVWLSRSVRLLPGQSTTVPVRLEGAVSTDSTVLLEGDPDIEATTGVRVMNVLMDTARDGEPQILLSNHSGLTQKLDKGAILGGATEVDVVEPGEEDTTKMLTESDPDQTEVIQLSGGHVFHITGELRDECRRKKLLELLGDPDIPPEEKEQLLEFLASNHEAFSLEEGERGETDLVEMVIDTGDAPPLKQAARRMPFSVRQEVARLLKEMQRDGVIEPSNSPWASPVVLVRKRDGSHRFCVDCRGLNTLTKADTFPLPRIDELLDQLGKSKYFSTIDLAAGFWQIKMHPDSREKTAFVTTQGLFHFKVMPFGLTNAPAVFQRLMQRVVMCLNPDDGPDFVSVYLDDILVFSETLSDHLDHLRRVIQRTREVGLKLKPTKCHFARAELEYLGHTITPGGVGTNPRLVAAVKEFPKPRSIHGVRRFLGLASFYRRFIPNFARIASPLHQLTHKGVVFKWTPECSATFNELKNKLTTAPVLAYPRFDRDFILETDASILGLGAVLSQVQDDGKPHPISFASRALSNSEKNYAITELETLAVVWAISHYHHHLYGHSVTVLTDHTAVRAVLETPSPSGKHARWWNKVYGRGVKEVKIVYRAGRENVSADALSRSPHDPAPLEGVGEDEMQISQVQSQATGPEASISELLQLEDNELPTTPTVSYIVEQKRDPELRQIIDFLQTSALPSDEGRARKIALQSPLFTIIDGTLFYLDPRHRSRRVVVPLRHRRKLLEETHAGRYGGHFSGKKLYDSLSLHWWWDGMYRDAMEYCKTCPECAIATGTGRILRPPLCPIPIARPFQVWGVDIMDLPKTEQGNQHAIVFQDLFTKWPMVYPAPDQKAIRIARLLTEQIVPLFGVPEALLSDRGANLLSHLMTDVCESLGVKKLNTTAYHPQCDGTVERFNRTLKSMLRKHAARFGMQWDRFLPRVLWSYRNTPHSSTGEKPSFLMFGIDCRSPTEAMFQHVPADMTDYRQELLISLSSARELAQQTIRKVQRQYKVQYDKRSREPDYKLGEWVLVRFPQEETGRNRKLSRPWHGPYRITDRRDPDITVTKVYFPSERTIQGAPDPSL